MKKQDCSKCGCSRDFLIKGTLIENQKVSVVFKTVCFKCLLEFINVDVYKYMNKEGRHIIMNTVNTIKGEQVS